MKPIDQAVVDLRTITDPYERLGEADRLDNALATARSVVAQIKRDTINSLRTPKTGYGSIAERVGLTKARVQQIANAPNKAGMIAYAFQDAHGRWHGQPGLLATGQYHDTPTARPFEPADNYNPLAGQTLTVRCGQVTDDEKVSMYALHVLRDDGNTFAVRMTHAVQDALFGPSILGTPERARWDAAREQKRRELDAK